MLGFHMLPLFALALASCSKCSASPVKKNDNFRAGETSTFFSQPSVQVSLPPVVPIIRLPQAKFEVIEDLQQIDLGKESTLEDLNDKVSPLLNSKYQNNHIVSRTAFDYLQNRIGVDEKIMEKYRAYRVRAFRRGSYKRRKEDHRSATLSLPRSEKASSTTASLNNSKNFSRDVQRQRANEIELEDLTKRIHEYGLQDETDFEIFYNHEDCLRAGVIAKNKVCSVLDEYMKRSKGIQDWKTGYLYMKRKLTSRESQRRKTQRDKKSKEREALLIQATHPTRSRKDKIRSLEALLDMPQSRPVLQARKRRHYKIVSSESEDNGKANKVDSATFSTVSPNVWPQKQRTKGRRPKVYPAHPPNKGLEGMDVADAEEGRVFIHTDAGPFATSTSSHPIPMTEPEMIKRPTTGGKTYTGTSSRPGKAFSQTSQLKLKEIA